MRTITPKKSDVSARITSRRDRLPQALWAAAVILTAVATCLRPQALPPAARATLEPFVTLAAVIAGSALAGRLGLFRGVAGVMVPVRASRAQAAASVLAFTALVSGLVNLDVAVVVAMPVALEAAARHRMSAGRMAVAVAMTANASSFLLPTSNITTLLLLGRARLLPLAYLRGSWAAWLLVAAVTIGSLTIWLTWPGAGPDRVAGAGVSGRAALDLIASVICRRIARESGAALSAWQFTLIGSALVPAQLAAAVTGLILTGALR